MTFVAVGTAIPQLGLARQVHAVAGGQVGFEARTRHFMVDPLRLRNSQPARIRVDLEHGQNILGDVVALELRHGALWAVAEMHGDMPEADAPWFWSVASTRRRDGSDVLIEGVAVVRQPAMTMASPLQFLPGKLNAGAVDRWRVPDRVRAVLRNAAQARTARSPGDNIIVRDDGGELVERSAAGIPTGDLKRPPGRLWHGAPCHRFVSVS